MKKLAVTFLHFNTTQDGVLAVSRKDNPNDFGLPGGKVEPGESLEEALRREVLEETGFRIFRVEKIFEREDGEYLVTTFRSAGPIIHERKPKEAGVVAWVTFDTLFEGCFGEYNRRLLEAVDKVA